MSKMFLVEAEHPAVPGIVRSLHRTRSLAETAAGELADQIATDLGLKPRVALSGLPFVQDAIAAWCERDDAEEDDSTYVAILELDVDPDPAHDLLRQFVDYFSAVRGRLPLVQKGRDFLRTMAS